MDGKDACVVTYFGDGGSSEVCVLLLFPLEKETIPSFIIFETFFFNVGHLLICQNSQKE